jgi:hypothetical protein
LIDETSVPLSNNRLLAEVSFFQSESTAMSDSENKAEEEPKLVVDTDWKEQVAREKEIASTSKGQGETEQDAAIKTEDSDPKTATAAAKSEDGSQDSGEYPPAPPASFEVLVSMLFTQAMAMLGHMPDPASGKTSVNKPYAKHYIDTLDMLGEKTKGNLSDEESKILSEALHALRMAYVNAKG